MLALIVGVAVALLVGINAELARRLASRRPLTLAARNEPSEQLRLAVVPIGARLAVGIALVSGVLAGVVAAQQWDVGLQWLHAQPFDRPDPHFGRVMAWFVFSLPVLLRGVSSLFGALVVTRIVTAAAYYVFGGIRLTESPRITPQANAHLSLLLAGLVAVRAWRFLLVQYLLSYS